MSFIYFNNTFFKNIRLRYFSPKIWRIIYLIKTNNIYHTSEKRIWTRNSFIPITFLLHEVIIYSGNIWWTKKITVWNIGFRFGEFTSNRRYNFIKKKKK